MPQREGYENAVNFTISLCLVFTICVGLLRLWIRRNAYGTDDIVIGAATLVSFGHTGSSYAALSAGLGRPWEGIKRDGQLAKLNQATLAGIILWFLALYLSKCSMIAFLSRITKTPSQIRLYHICNGAVGLIGVVSIIVVLAGCPTSPESRYYWNFSDNIATCPSQDGRWKAVTALDIITEIVLLVLPIHLVWSLQMRLAKKAMIIVAFWVRLPTLAFSITRNYFTIQLQHPSSDAGLDSALVAIWLEIELAYAIAASTLSALKTFTDSFNSGFGLGQLRGKAEDDSYGLSNVSGSSGGRTRNEKPSSKYESPAGSRNRGSVGHPAELSKGGVEDRITPLPPPVPPIPTDQENGALKLRPETDLATYTNISAGSQGGDQRWRTAGSDIGSDTSSGDDTQMVIVREHTYDVQFQHDEAPLMIPHPAHRA